MGDKNAKTIPPRPGPAFRRRRFSVRHSRALEKLYSYFEKLLAALDPLFRALGYQRLEFLTKLVEKPCKKLLFDCQMCGQCALSSTGMSCPTNCPKSIRNGPCGGVRPNGNCEVEPQMPCVWVEAWAGAQSMRENKDLMAPLPPIDHRLWNRSSWLATAEEKAAERNPKPTADVNKQKTTQKAKT